MAAPNSPFLVLVVEDNPAGVGLVRLALKDLQIECTLQVASDGEQALEQIKQIDKDSRGPSLDLVLLDMHLPKYSGEEILRRLRSTELCAQTPVVVMTSSTSPSDQQFAERHAALCYFGKPADLTGFAELGRIIRDILSRRQTLREGV